MGQYAERVERQRKLLKAEKWANVPKSLHAHSMNSMWYDDRPQDTKNSGVMDIHYNGGWIDRHKNGSIIHTFGEKLNQKELLDAYTRAMADEG